MIISNFEIAFNFFKSQVLKHVNFCPWPTNINSWGTGDDGNSLTQSLETHWDTAHIQDNGIGYVHTNVIKRNHFFTISYLPLKPQLESYSHIYYNNIISEYKTSKKESTWEYI
jgi:hypothetical protein